jgi:hypothetical protein
LTVAIVALSLVSCVGICAGAYHLTEIRKSEIQQAGIDRRAMAKLQTGESVPRQGDWWEPLALELVKNPKVLEMVQPYIPGLLDKFVQKKV